jgi:hypothetical protein
MGLFNKLRAPKDRGKDPARQAPAAYSPPRSPDADSPRGVHPDWDTWKTTWAEQDKWDAQSAVRDKEYAQKQEATRAWSMHPDNPDSMEGQRKRASSISLSSPKPWDGYYQRPDDENY